VEPSYWKEKWQIGDIGFHQSEVEPLLIKYFSALSPGRVLVPLCGKTKDMKWLLDKGWTVIGIEVTQLHVEISFLKII
jgi:thiopurine S-methyltransferase